ncbi:hypothetical protein BXO87_01890 [Bacillus sp. GZB]|uniref:zinc finger-like domain-containing protein n=1 Tax=Bacillus sp. GZB TaxID=936599 RepID=UPI000977A985|nr:zinc finger-like domain-containing protein [Bacillus sp. GZB]OMQ06781.1 hypothetical protein BXO87_01890 [Bacillus sp. GZB]
MNNISILDWEQTFQNSKSMYRTVLTHKRNVLHRIKEYKRLGIFSGTDREDLLYYYNRDSLNTERHRKNALKYFIKISLFNSLFSGVGFNNAGAGIRIPLTVEQSYSEADDILESGNITEEYANSEIYYSERVENNFIGTYPVIIERVEDYGDFLKVLVDDIVLMNKSINFSISYEEWKTGYKVDGKRKVKLNKFLRKQGFSQYTLDYYSQQIKTEKSLYLTVSDRVQHIAGMSFYSTGDWNSMGGTSCQDPRNEYEECLDLLPSMYDNKLFIAFLHEDVEDVADTSEKMLARTMCRLININGKQFLIGSQLYGNNETKDELDKALSLLNSYNVFSLSQMIEGTTVHIEQTNGQFLLEGEDEVYLCNDFEELVNCECPACGGSGEYTVENNRGSSVDIECPVCGGSGDYETFVHASVDTYVTVSDERELEPYSEGYTHFGNSIKIRIDEKVLGLK